MKTLGFLVIKVYVHTQQPDEHGRTGYGNWKTLLSRMMERSEVDATIKRFMDVNPWLNPNYADLDMQFITKEHIH